MDRVGRQSAQSAVMFKVACLLQVPRLMLCLGLHRLPPKERAQRVKADSDACARLRYVEKRSLSHRY